MPVDVIDAHATLVEREKMVRALREMADEVLHEGYDDDLTSAIVAIQVTESGLVTIRGLGHVDSFGIIGMCQTVVNRLARGTSAG